MWSGIAPKQEYVAQGPLAYPLSSIGGVNLGRISRMRRD